MLHGACNALVRSGEPAPLEQHSTGQGGSLGTEEPRLHGNCMWHTSAGEDTLAKETTLLHDDLQDQRRHYINNVDTSVLVKTRWPRQLLHCTMTCKGDDGTALATRCNKSKSQRDRRRQPSLTWIAGRAHEECVNLIQFQVVALLPMLLAVTRENEMR